MNRALPEMLNCLNTPGNYTAGYCTDMTVLERQRARLKWLQQEQLQQQQSYFSGSEINGLLSVPDQVGQVQGFEGLVGNSESVFGESMNRFVKVDPDVENGWPELGKFQMPNICFRDSGLMNGTGFQLINGSIPRTISCPPVVAAGHEPSNHSEVPLPEKLSSASGREACKKRKAEKSQSSKIVTEDETREKRTKGSAEEGESKITEQNSTKNDNRETSADTSKENSKVSEVQKPDYIHVRARRGQATDSHSLAERVRREKISERMKYLQDLVPGCNKITSKAGMLDEIINYVQSLQRQVEFLSMKLATVNPRLDFNVDDLFVKEMFPACNTSFQTVGMSSEMTNSAYLQFNPVQQLVSCSGSEIEMSSVDPVIRRTISAPVSIPERFFDTSCFNQLQHPGTWDSDLQNLLNVEFNQLGRSSTSFQSQPFTGPIEAGILKMGI